MKSSWEWYRGMISLVLSCTRTHPEGDGQAELTRVFLLLLPFCLVTSIMFGHVFDLGSWLHVEMNCPH